MNITSNSAQPAFGKFVATKEAKMAMADCVKQAPRFTQDSYIKEIKDIVDNEAKNKGEVNLDVKDGFFRADKKDAVSASVSTEKFSVTKLVDFLKKVSALSARTKS